MTAEPKARTVTGEIPRLGSVDRQDNVQRPAQNRAWRTSLAKARLYASKFIFGFPLYFNLMKFPDQVKSTFGWKKYYYRLLQDSLFAFRSHESKTPKDEVELYCAKTKDCSWEVRSCNTYRTARFLTQNFS